MNQPVPCLPVAARRTILFASIVVAVQLGAASAAEAQGRVVVEPLGGPRGARIRSLLIRNLEENGVRVIPYDEMRQASQSRGFGGGLTEDQYARVARALGATAFVDGRVFRKRRRWGLVVRVRGGADGSTVGIERWGGRTLGALRAVRANAYRRLKSHLSRAQSAVARAQQKWQQKRDEREEQDRRAERRRQRQSARRRQRQRDAAPPTDAEEAADASEQPDEGTEPTAGGGATDTAGSGEYWTPGDDAGAAGGGGADEGAEGEEDGEEDTDEGDGSGEFGEWMKRYAFASISLLAGVQTRSLSAEVFTHPDVRPKGGSEVRQYRSTGHGEVGFEAEFYPGALSEEQTVPWFGGVVHFRHSLLLETQGAPCAPDQGPSCPGPSVESIGVDTTQWELFLGARGRYRVWFGERALRLNTEFGWGRFAFKLAPDDLKKIARSEIIPPFEYTYLQLGFGVAADIVPVYWTAGLRLGYRLGLSPGAGARNVWGTGTPTLQGWTVGLESKVRLPFVTRGAFALLQVQHFSFRTTFTGQPACANSEGCSGPGDLWEQWPEDGAEDGIPEPVTDRYWRVGVQLGYEFQ